MNLRMAKRAGLELGRLIVKRRCSGRAAESGRRMALQAQHVNVAEFQQVRIRGTVHDMARRASLGFHRSMLEYEWPLLIGVAGEADHILRGRAPDLFRPYGPVRIVAIGALNKALVHAMVEGHIELRFLLQMAGIAKLRLRLDEQEFLCHCVVR